MNRLLNKISEAAELILKAQRSKVLIVSHYDADGLAAASILTATFREAGCYTHVMIVEQLTARVIEEVHRLSSNYYLTIIADMGSNAPNDAQELEDLIVLDHHIPGDKSLGFEVNPHRLGIDGSREISAAGLAYLLARSIIGEKAIQLAPLAIVGALGDRQDAGRRFRLVGVNRVIVEEAIKYNLIRETIGLRIAGGLNRPLVRALAFTTDPFIPGITGDEGAALGFLKRIGIRVADNGKQRTIKELSREERRRLASELVKYLIGLGFPVGTYC